ncbi:hypothetical protein CC2G_012880 [Coprinopsis cinerea AmutBmut pab1-1]|nr:hypothetical protein CC2G_012880 [Coprinopsis cinerea AmutBmut pab1-1]
MPSLPRQSIIQPPGVGASRDKPIYLRGPTITQFRHLLYASTVYPAIDLNSLSLEQVLSIAEWAFNFGLTHLKTWSQKAMSSLFIPAANSPLRTASNDIFFRALRLASLYRLPEVSSAVQVKWITRILWHELSPVPAIILADRCDFRSLLSHAYYTHMVELGVRLTESNFISDPSSILTRKHRTHLLAGYHSLSAYWKHLRISPPPFEQAPQCKLHRQCCAAWKMRWSVACSRPCSIPEMDVLRRLRFVEDLLKEDMLVEVCLASGCRALALDSISKKRTDISNNLHHHFDLA